MAGLIFMLDLDGTLVDSEPLKGMALADTCSLYSHPVDSNIYAEVMGRDWDTVLSHFFEQAGINPDRDEFTGKFRHRYLELLDTRLSLTKGAERFFALANNLKARLAIVSSAAPWMVDRVLALTGVRDTFEIVISQADVKRHKPDPEAYELALNRLNANSVDSIVIEDSTPGLIAAHRAGCASIAMRHNFNKRHDFSLAKLVVSDFNELCDSSLFLEGGSHASIAHNAPD